MIDSESAHRDETQHGQTEPSTKVGREGEPLETAFFQTFDDLQVRNLQEIVLGLTEFILVIGALADMLESVEGELVCGLGD